MNHEAIRNLYPNAAIIDDGAGVFDIDGNKLTIDMSAVEVEAARLDVIFKAKQYQRDRAAAYPSIADQLDKLYHEGYDGWKAAIEAVKTQYPKPTE